MNKAVPWNINGVGFDAREAAREAARRQGKSLGEWLDGVIADHAAESGLDEHSVRTQDRIDAVTRRLERLGESAAEAVARPEPSVSRLEPRSFRGDAEPVSRARRSDRETSARSSAGEHRLFDTPLGSDSDLLLDGAIAAMERRAVQSERKTERAIASLARIIDANEHRRDDEREVFSSLTRKLSDMETRIASKGSDDGYRPIKGALARLEARLDTLGRRGTIDALSVERLEAAPVDPSVGRLEAKLDSLLDVMTKRSAIDAGMASQTSTLALAAAHSMLGPDRLLASDTPAPAGPRASGSRRLGEAIAEIARRQRALDDGPSATSNVSRGPVSASTPTPPGLQGEITALAGQIEAMRQDLATLHTAPRGPDSKPSAVASSAELDGLKTEIAAMSATLNQLAPRGTVTALEEAIRGLTRRLETSRSDADITTQGGSPLRPVSEVVGDIRHSLDTLDRRRTIDGLEREVRSLGGKLDSLNGVDATALGRIQNQTEEIRTLLAVAAEQPLAVERIEQQVAALSERIDRHPQTGSADDRTFREVADQIRGLLANPPGGALLDKIERRLESLTSKVDQAVTEAAGARQVAELSRRHFDAVQTQLAARLSTSSDERGADAQGLESLVEDLAARIEAVRAPDASGQAIEALQQQVMRLADRFERADGELSALPSIERAMRDLFDHLEETRAQVESSAARAAREAAVAAISSRPALDAAAAQDIVRLKAAQAETDKRTQATLHAVHETLEKVVDRMSLMEGDIASVRGKADGASVVHRIAEASGPARLMDRPPVRAVRKDAGRDDKTLPDLVLGSADILERPLASAKPVTRPVAHDLDEGAGRADFIAAARRAVQAARHDPSVVAMKRPEQQPIESGDVRAGLLAKTRAYVATHKKPVLLSVAALFVLFGALSVLDMRDNLTPARPVVAARDTVERSRMAALPPRDVTPVAPRSSEAALTADLSPSALPKAPAPASKALPGSEPVQTGAMSALPSFAAQGLAPAVPPVAPTGSLRQMAESGNAAAQYEVGLRYAEGRLLVKDFTQAAAWYEKAANQGLAPAQYKLASLYEKGMGVARDKAKARAWYLKAADAGNPRAMHNLAVLLADGDGKPDYASAVVWFRKAAEYGVHDSQYNLAILLARGLGTSQSLVQSYQWFAVAARDNDSDAATKRDEVGAKMNANDVAVAKALASAFHPKTSDMAATEVEPPAGGWDGASSPSLVRSSRQRISSL